LQRDFFARGCLAVLRLPPTVEPACHLEPQEPHEGVSDRLSSFSLLSSSPPSQLRIPELKRMIRFLLFFTIVLSLASGVLAFLTKEKAGEMTEKLAAVSQTVTVLKNDNVKLKEEKKTVEASADEVEKSVKAQKDEVEKLRLESEAKQAEVAKVQADLAKARAKEAELEKKLQDAPPPPAVPAVDPAAEQAMAAMKAELEKARQALADEQKIAAQKVQAAEAKALAVAAKPKDSQARSASGKQPLEGRVVAYNAGWNFVVVNLGDRQGVTPESKLEVIRGGALMARLEVTEVQPKFASATISYVKGLPKGLEVQPGDVVRFAAKDEGPEPVLEPASLTAGPLPVQGNADPLP